MDKITLRKELFEKYFEEENGVLATDLIDKLSFIPETWKKLHVLCERNVKYFDSYSSLEKLKMVEHHQKKYLILKLRMFNYIIIDIEKTKNITEEQFRNEFDENFFINNFDEINTQDNSNMFRLYNINNYNGNIQELIDFYVENQTILSLPTKLKYNLMIGNAWTYFCIDFVNAKAQIGFQTPDQFLYEHLFLKYDLTPCGMQDAQEKIGIERMKEMFERIKKIKISKEVIPNELYQQFLIQCNIKNNKLEKVKVPKKVINN